jgi:hypothetical protein
VYAQPLHWDVAAQAGVAERFARSPAPRRTPGPTAELHGHLALYPMVRVGAYAAFDLSPTEGVADRRIYAGGVRIKVAPPWLPTPWRVWTFLGFGGAYVQMPGGPSFRGASTSTAEVPVGVGLGRRLAGPWEIYVELAGRLEIAGFGWHREGPAPPGGVSTGTDVDGEDLLAVSLNVGVSLTP